MIRTAVAKRELGQAVEYLEKISTDSPQRAEAELSLGGAFWGAYARAVRQEENRPPQEELDKWDQPVERDAPAGHRPNADGRGRRWRG